MQKFTAWIRRHRTKFLDIGIVIGLALITWGYFNAPVNINRMTPADWQDTHISKVGTVTIQKLQANAPYTDIRDVDKINGIGKVKTTQISHYFTTWDTAKADAWFPLDIAGLILFFGCVFVLHVKKSDQRYRAKQLDEKLFKDKNVKR
jgi:hypothetical protein